MARTLTPDVVAPPPRHPRFPLIDGMRAIAVVAVVAVHAATVSNLDLGSFTGRLIVRTNIGVTLFFLISGFLLYRPMIAYRGAGARAPAVRDYLKRRALRIYPAYWLVLTVLAVLPHAPRVLVGPWWAMYGLVHTLPLYHGPECVSSPCALAQTWSLVVELTFYAALPLYSMAMELATRRLGLRAWIVAQVVILGSLSILSIVLQFAVLKPLPAWFGASVLAYVDWFALGMLMAVGSVAAGRVALPKTLERWPGALGTLLWLGALGGFIAISLWLPATTFLIDRTDLLVGHVTYGLIAAALLLPAVLKLSAGLPARVAGWRPIAWLGEISYGVFLWHLAIIMKLGHGSFVRIFLEALVLSSLCAAASYYLLERPVLRLKYASLGEHPVRRWWTARRRSQAPLETRR